MTSSVLPAEYYRQYSLAANDIVKIIPIVTSADNDNILFAGKFLEVSKLLSDAILEVEGVSAFLKLEALIRAADPESHVHQYSSLLHDRLKSHVPLLRSESWMEKDAMDWINDQTVSSLVCDTKENTMDLLDIPELLKVVPLESLEVQPGEGDRFIITMENVRLALENCLQDHAYAHTVCIEGSNFVIEMMPDYPPSAGGA